MATSFLEPSFHPLPSSYNFSTNCVYRLPAVTRRDSEITVRDTFENRHVYTRVQQSLYDTLAISVRRPNLSLRYPVCGVACIVQGKS